MLSPSRGFCFCLPVRLGALVVSLFAFLGSGILAGVNFHSLATFSAHISSTQTAGFYLTSLSWVTLALFSLLGFISVIIQHPLALTIFARFVYYHLPASLFCNLFFATVLFHSYRGMDAVLQSPQCTQISRTTSTCDAYAFLERLSWVYVFIILPACIFQTYIYVMIKRFIFVVSGEWALQREEIFERQRRSMGVTGPQRRTTITQAIGNGGRRRAKALWFTMETPNSPETGAGDSFLPSMIISPSDAPRTPFTMSPTAGLLSPVESPSRDKALNTSVMPPTSPSGSREEMSDRSVSMDMDFSDSASRSLQSGEWEPGYGKGYQSDPRMRSGQVSSSSTKI